MLTLYILRHAKSSWALPGVNDHDRSLNDRGINDLPKIGQMMKANGFVPDMVLCSSAKRTQDTLEGVLLELATKPPVSISSDLYASGSDYYLRIIKNAPDCKSLMIVGHNPMCDEITRLLVKDGEAQAIADLAEHYPTGTLAVMEFEEDDWQDIKPKSAFLKVFQIPKNI
jgi:phosphohistidine phosphatase